MEAGQKQCAIVCYSFGQRPWLHEVRKTWERYARRVGAELRKPDVAAFFAELLQRVVPKHDAQARRRPWKNSHLRS